VHTGRILGLNTRVGDDKGHARESPFWTVWVISVAGSAGRGVLAEIVGLYLAAQSEVQLRRAPRTARRPHGKARRPRISGIFEGGATPPPGMHRRSNADGVAPRAALTTQNPLFESEKHHRAGRDEIAERFVHRLTKLAGIEGQRADVLLAAPGVNRLHHHFPQPPSPVLGFRVDVVDECQPPTE